jgi:hypothetical protein
MDQTDLFSEIKEELRQEKLYILIRKLVPFLVGIALLMILVTAIIVWRNKVELEDQYKMSEIFYKAVTTEKLGKIDTALEAYNYLIDNHIGSYASIAALKKASLLVNRSEYEKAFVIYENFVKEKSNHQLLKYLAETKMATMLLNEQVERKTNLEELLDKLQTKSNPWRGMSSELKVLWLLRSHQEKEAEALIEMILQDENLASSYKQRAEAIRAIKFSN